MNPSSAQIVVISVITVLVALGGMFVGQAALQGPASPNGGTLALAVVLLLTAAAGASLAIHLLRRRARR